ncbi:hypothetical protein GCM10010392_67420 [Streptomyces clavifer]|nr:hypothetical protein GCM10010392_67420 [Streptomyces clavifer]
MGAQAELGALVPAPPPRGTAAAAVQGPALVGAPGEIDPAYLVGGELGLVQRCLERQGSLWWDTPTGPDCYGLEGGFGSALSSGSHWLELGSGSWCCGSRELDGVPPGAAAGRRSSS